VERRWMSGGYRRRQEIASIGLQSSKALTIAVLN
jgi:hypothetical protein